MERNKNKNYLIGEILIRPLAVCALILSGTFFAPETHASKLSTPLTASFEPFNSPFQNDYLKPPTLIKTIHTSNEISETAKDLNSIIENFRMTDLVISGIAGYYSREGCLGCSAELLMSNGEPLNDNNLTLAVPLIIPLNSQVLVENIKNGQFAIATATDRGGFGDLPIPKIADLTPALKDAIGGTDLMDVKITVLEPTPSNP